MKTILPRRSVIIKKKLDNIIQEILAVGKEKIAMIAKRKTTAPKVAAKISAMKTARNAQKYCVRVPNI